jgi:hypothetical protein
VFIRNISQADLQKVFVNESKWVQACIDTRAHHFQHLLQVHSDFLNKLYHKSYGFLDCENQMEDLLNPECSDFCSLATVGSDHKFP